MKNKNKLIELQKVVYPILNNQPSTRDNDFLLINEVYQRLGIDTSKSFQELTTSINDYPLPSFESITRCRRKLQAKYNFLKSTKQIEKLREKQEEIYKEYARNKNQNLW